MIPGLIVAFRLASKLGTGLSAVKFPSAGAPENLVDPAVEELSPGQFTEPLAVLRSGRSL
eukprot:8446286-Lingulodinium_polyedra.AAC.1